MSHPKSLKLQLGSDIHKITDIPATLAALRTLFTGLFGSSDLTIKYKSKDSDWVTIGSDIELQTAYTSFQGESALKLLLSPVERFEKYLPEGKEIQREEPPAAFGLLSSISQSIKSAFQKGKTTVQKVNYRRQFERLLINTEVCIALGVPMPVEHPGTSCAHCKLNPIRGIRYKCTICVNFDFCDVCEATIEHEHPFLKIKATDEKKSPSFMSLFMGDKRPAMAAVDRRYVDRSTEHFPGEQIMVSWILRNSGKYQWPKKTRISRIRGDIYALACEVPLLNPGEEAKIDIFVAAPKEFGLHKGFFGLTDKDNTRFGDELEVELQVVPNPDLLSQQITALEDMGFSDRERILAALTVSGGDLDKAIDSLSA